jgi:hypothetical protein
LIPKKSHTRLRLQNEERAEKLRAHASHLLDDFILLRQRFAMLVPMLFNTNVVRARGAGAHRRGFMILRSTLFLSCAQDIAKAAFDWDKDNTIPSIGTLVAALQDDSVRAIFRAAAVSRETPWANEDPDPEVRQALLAWRASEREAQGARFDDTWKTVQARWTRLRSQPYMDACRTIRNKVTAHTVVQFVEDVYQPIDIAALGLKWSELALALDEMQFLVDKLNGLTRCAGFAWDHLHVMLDRDSLAFWLVDPGDGNQLSSK